MNFKVSSTSSRQSTTSPWYSEMYLGSILTMEASPVMPMYLREWLSEERNLAIVVEARSMRG